MAKMSARDRCSSVAGCERGYVAERHEIATRHNADRCDGGLQLGRRAAELSGPVAQLVVFVHVSARGVGWTRLLLSSATIASVVGNRFYASRGGDSRYCGRCRDEELVYGYTTGYTDVRRTFAPPSNAFSASSIGCWMRERFNLTLPNRPQSMH
jgi:hypothetical protein